MTEIEIEMAGLPAWFCERYWEEIETWIQNRPRVGPNHHIILKEAPFADPSPNEDVGPVLRRVQLTSSVVRASGGVRVRVEPASDHDDFMIRMHVEKMVKLGVRPRQFTKEAPRAYVPFMPRIVKPNGGG